MRFFIPPFRFPSRFGAGLMLVLLGGLAGPAHAADFGLASQPLLSLQTVLIVLGAFAVFVLLVVAWSHSLRRQVRRKTEQMLERLELQARRQTGVQNAARLESLEALAGGIAHDYNNLLTIIMGNVALMKDSPQLRGSDAAHGLAEIERSVERARDLTRQLLTFATGGEPSRAPMDVEEMVRTVVEKTLRGTKLGVEFTVEPGLWAGDGDRDQLVQVVQNIVNNSLQAGPHHGNLRVALANHAVESDGTETQKPGRYVRVAISDSGTGIAPDVLPKIFDPYFTTRRGSRGLGLATVYSIVNRHGGWVDAASTLGLGTTVTLWLPATMVAITKETPEPSSVPAPATSVTPGKPRVLLMDDEEGVRTIASTVLLRMGLDVTAVADGESALVEFEKARNSNRPYALLIVDLTIQGGMGGRETVEAIRKLDPLVPAIVSSGYSSDPVMANYQSYGFQAMVAKPFGVSALAEVVRRFIPLEDPS
ncbi:MAG TPA: ATP-binding protein [Lacunisphaera sp.]